MGLDRGLDPSRDRGLDPSRDRGLVPRFGLWVLTEVWIMGLDRGLDYGSGPEVWSRGLVPRSGPEVWIMGLDQGFGPRFGSRDPSRGINDLK